VRLGWFPREWAAMIAALDRNVPSEALPVLGVAPVDSDADGSDLAAALSEHRDNLDLEALMRPVEFIDDRMANGQTYADMSPLRALDRLRDSAAAVYSWSAYFDGGYPYAAVKRYLALSDGAPNNPHRLILGPWDHGNRALADTTHDVSAVSFDFRGEILRFCDAHLSDAAHPLHTEDPVHYYTMNEGRWKHAASWPPTEFEPTPYYLSANGSLNLERSSDVQGEDHYAVDYSATSGPASRWRSYVNTQGLEIGYPDRVEQDRKLLVYDSAPLERDIEVTGHPVVALFVIADTHDSAFHIYLEEVRDDGRVVYVTEGVFRAIHRRISDNVPAWEKLAPHHTYRRADAEPLVPGDVAEIRFGLLPVSYLFKAGSRIRLACAGADRDNFDRIPSFGPAPRWSVQRNSGRPSSITLPQRVRENSGASDESAPFAHAPGKTAEPKDKEDG